MKRQELLQLRLNEDKQLETQITQTLKDDKKFIRRAKRDLEDSIEDLEAELQKRLSSEVALDKSIVEVHFTQLLAKKELLNTYEQFEKNYL
jgi:hypothetical protein